MKAWRTRTSQSRNEFWMTPKKWSTKGAIIPEPSLKPPSCNQDAMPDATPKRQHIILPFTGAPPILNKNEQRCSSFYFKFLIKICKKGVNHDCICNIKRSKDHRQLLYQIWYWVYEPVSITFKLSNYPNTAELSKHSFMRELALWQQYHQSMQDFLTPKRQQLITRSYGDGGNDSWKHCGPFEQVQWYWMFSN